MDLKQAVSALLEKVPPSSLRKASRDLSKIYFEGDGSRRIVENEALSFCYLATRIPAIYGAVNAVLKRLPISPISWLDLGAGPGTAAWAALALFPESKQFTLMERSRPAIALGKQLMSAHPILQQAKWIPATLPTTLPKADAAILSYSLNEIDRPFQMIEAWWKSETPILIIVEPGTPRGFTLIR